MEPIRGKIAITDKCYRYKMEKIIFQRQGARTCIPNIVKISTDIKFPYPELIIAYFKKKISTSIAEKDKNCYISNVVDKMQVQEALYEFIDIFVLCQKCKLPELTYNLNDGKNKKKIIKPQCRSCGNIGIIEENDLTEKIIRLFETKLSVDIKQRKIKGEFDFTSDNKAAIKMDSSIKNTINQNNSNVSDEFSESIGSSDLDSTNSSDSSESSNS